jgi:hypothetical protein
MAQIKGAAIRGVLKFVKHAGGKVTIPGVIAELPPAQRAIFDRVILTGEWYPVAAYHQLLKVVDRKIGAGDLALMPQLGRYSARQDVSGIFKIISVLASIPRILQSASTFWGRYHDTGSFEIVELEEQRGTARIVDYPEMSEEHSHVLLGWIEGIGLASGAKHSVVQLTRSMHWGDPYFEYRMEWQ